MSRHSKQTAEFALLGTAAMEGLYPVLANIASTKFPPVFFVGVSVCVALIGLLLYCCMRGTLKHGIDVRALPYAFGVAAIVLTGFVCILIGTRYTSGINTALLLQNEMLVAFLVATFLLSERISLRQFFGIVAVLLGTIAILFNGTMAVNRGDVIILLTTLLFPFANILAKKGLSYVAPSVFLLLRYVFGAIMLCIGSFAFEDPVTFMQTMDAQHIQLILLYGIVVLTLSKIFWYVGLRTLPLGLATYIASASPVFSLFFAFALLSEIPSSYQWLGFALTVAGVYLLIAKTKPSSVPADLV